MPESTEDTIRKLQEAIASIEQQRAALGDAVVNTTLQALEKQISELQPQQQRKQATILMMDIANHTSIIRNLDPEENMEIIDQAMILLEKPISDAGGRVTRFSGDGFKAIFGHPEAHDNDPEMAIRAGLEILKRSAGYALELEQQRGITGFQVRIGIDTGIVLVGGFSEGEDTVKGEAVNLASRLEQSAPPGGMLISAHTERLVHSLFDLQPIAPLTLKSFNEPVPAFQVLGTLEQSFRDETRGVDWVRTPIVGRDEQIETLTGAIAEVVAKRQPRVITVVAEAGVGKSRLMAEFESRLPEGTQLYKGRSQREYEGTPYAVFRNLFSRHLGIQENYPAHDLMSRFENEIAPLFGEEEEGRIRAHFIGNLLGFDFSRSRFLEGVVDDAQQLSDRAWSYLIEYFIRAAEQSPCILLLEDIHWADAQSLDVITQLAHDLIGRPLLILCNARPILFERRKQWGSTNAAFQTMRLPALSRRDSRRLIGEILTKAENIPLILREFIVSGAEGNPFYIEELIKMLVENGVIDKTGDVWQIEQTRLLDLEVPPTLTGVVQARLDSLAPLEKTLLQQASVVGRNFWDGVLFHINSSGRGSPEHEGIRQALAALQDKEMIFPKRQGAFAGFQEYVFKHAILREVTYETVLKRMRPVYHGLVAEWLIDFGAEDTSEFTPKIAGHLEQAGQLERAAVYLRKAGEQSMKQYANGEAVGYLSRALELLPEQEAAERFRTLQARIQVYSLLGDRPTQKVDIFALSDLAKTLDDDAKRGEVALLQAVFASEHSEYNNIIKYSKQAIRYSSASGVPRLEGQARQLWGRALIAQGDYAEARVHLEKAIEIARETGLAQVEADSLRYLGIVAERLETIENAMEQYEHSLAIYRRIGDLRGEGWVLKDLGNLKLRRQDLREEGVAHIQRFQEITEKIGDLLGKGSSFHKQAEVARRKGDFASANELLIKAIGIADRTGNETIEVDSLFELGIIAIEQSEFADAGRHFSRMLEVVKTLGNKPMEAKSLMEIGRLFHRQGDYVRAMNYYQQSYDRFKDLGNRRSTPRVLAHIGLLQHHLNNDGEALEVIKKAQEMLEPLNFPLEMAFVLTQMGRAHQGLGEDAEALRVYREAFTLYESAKERTRSLEPYAGLADVFLKTGEVGMAREITEHILQAIETAETEAALPPGPDQAFIYGLEGITDPTGILFTCCRVLEALGDDRAGRILAKLVRIINAQAARIEEIDQKQAFLSMPIHQKILSLKEINFQAAD